MEQEKRLKFKRSKKKKSEKELEEENKMINECGDSLGRERSIEEKLNIILEVLKNALKLAEEDPEFKARLIKDYNLLKKEEKEAKSMSQTAPPAPSANLQEQSAFSDVQNPSNEDDEAPPSKKPKP
ncbi:hypothetical protein ACTXT7_005542 [Hymenolepis weldensis]